MKSAQTGLKIANILIGLDLCNIWVIIGLDLCIICVNIAFD
jgi:hypothetical protein